MHKSRVNRKANTERRFKHGRRSHISVAQQQEIAQERARIYNEQYPTPPDYPQPNFGSKGRI